MVLRGERCFKATGGPGAEKVLHFYLSSARQGTNCEAAKGLEGALSVQYFILMGSGGVIKGQRWRAMGKSGGDFHTWRKTLCLQERRAKRAEGSRQGQQDGGEGLQKKGRQKVERRRQTRSDAWSDGWEYQTVNYKEQHFCMSSLLFHSLITIFEPGFVTLYI